MGPVDLESILKNTTGYPSGSGDLALYIECIASMVSASVKEVSNVLLSLGEILGILVNLKWSPVGFHPCQIPVCINVN